MRNIILVSIAVVLLAGCSMREAIEKADQAVVIAEQAVAIAREQKDTAIALGMDPEQVANIDAHLERSQAYLEEARRYSASARQAAENGNWLSVILAVAGTFLGGAGGLAVLGPKAAMAARAVHVARAVVSGVESLKSPETKPLIEETMRGVMTPQDKAMVRELRAGQI
jgi:uncharacterized protein (UPF0261 family)